MTRLRNGFVIGHLGGMSLLVLGLFACDVGSDGSDSTGSGDADTTSIDPVWLVCSQADDCTVIEIGCCDHCNGGEAIGVRKDKMEIAKAALGPAPGECQNTECTLMGCAPMIPECAAGQCKATPDPSWMSGCENLNEAQCSLAPGCDALMGALLEDYCVSGSVGKDAVFTACFDNDPPVSCGGAMTCAMDETTGKKYVFSSTCVPPGWEPCDLECVEPPDCEELPDEQTCLRTAGCIAYMGSSTRDVCEPPDIGGWSQFYGCGPDPGACDTAIGCATSPDGNDSAWFPTLCFPPNWEACDTTECGNVDCSVLNETQCVANDACWPLRGAPPADVCAGDFSTWMSVFGGCDRFGIGCGDAETCGVDLKSGQSLIFPSTCLPKGWTACDFDPCAQTDECLAGAKAELGQLCVRGTFTAGNVEKLDVGQPIKIQTKPKGCYSSSCTEIHTATCSATLDTFATDVTALFCLENIPDPACTADCSGGGFANCETPMITTMGTYTVTMGDLMLTVRIPSELPLGGSCVGDPF